MTNIISQEQQQQQLAASWLVDFSAGKKKAPIPFSRFDGIFQRISGGPSFWIWAGNPCSAFPPSQT